MKQNYKKLILVNYKDQPIGFMEKIQVHKIGKLHRAISIFVFNNQGHLMIQKRSIKKYHSALLWSNTVCGHPYKGENTELAAYRRLKEEMGFVCTLKKKFFFIYKANINNIFTENEFDHVFVGNYNGIPLPDNQEIIDWKWITLDKLKKSIKKFPEKYSIWFKIIINNYLNNLFF